VDRFKARVDHQGIDLPANQGVSTRGRAARLDIWIAICAALAVWGERKTIRVTFDGRYRATGSRGA